MSLIAYKDSFTPVIFLTVWESLICFNFKNIFTKSELNGVLAHDKAFRLAGLENRQIFLRQSQNKDIDRKTDTCEEMYLAIICVNSVIF